MFLNQLKRLVQKRGNHSLHPHHKKLTKVWKCWLPEPVGRLKGVKWNLLDVYQRKKTLSILDWNLKKKVIYFTRFYLDFCSILISDSFLWSRSASITINMLLAYVSLCTYIPIYLCPHYLYVAIFPHMYLHVPTMSPNIPICPYISLYVPIHPDMTVSYRCILFFPATKSCNVCMGHLLAVSVVQDRGWMLIGRNSVFLLS